MVRGVDGNDLHGALHKFVALHSGDEDDYHSQLGWSSIYLMDR